MVIGSLYLIAFVIGTYLVWKLGRDEYYDEEKLIDLVLFSSTTGLLVSRLAYFLTASGQEELNNITTSTNVWLGIVQFFQLSNGNIWWAGAIAFVCMGLFLLWRWNWPYWPVMGFLLLATGVTTALSELFVWYFRGLMYGGLLLGGGVILALSMVWGLRFGGERRVLDLLSGFQHGLEQRRESIFEKRLAKMQSRDADKKEDASDDHTEPSMSTEKTGGSSQIPFINLGQGNEDPKKAW